MSAILRREPFDGRDRWLLAAIAAVCLGLGLGVVAAFRPVLAAQAIGALLALSVLAIVARRYQSSFQPVSAAYLLPLALSLMFLSLVPVWERDATSEGLGLQAFYELALQAGSLALLLLALAGKQLRVLLSPGAALWCGLAGLAILSAIWAPQTQLAAVKGLQLFLVVTVTVVVASQFRDRALAVRFLVWTSILLIAGLIVLQAITEGPDSLIMGNRQRLTLLSMHPLVLGGFAGTVAVISLVSRPRGLDWLAFGLLVTVTVLADARAPLGLLVVFFIAYLILASGSSRQARQVSAVLAMLLLVAGILGAVYIVNGGMGGPSAVVPDLDSEDFQTLNGRIPLWDAVFSSVENRDDATNSVLLGNGYASFRHFGLDQFAYAGDAHNAAIQFLFELGVVGLILFLSAYLFLAREVSRLAHGIRERLILILPLVYLFSVQMLEASLADSRSFLLVTLLVYAHGGANVSQTDESTELEETEHQQEPAPFRPRPVAARGQGGVT